MTRDQLHNYAVKQDGCCKIAWVNGQIKLYSQNKDLQGICAAWDYYFTDEPECFDFEQFGL